MTYDTFYLYFQKPRVLRFDKEIAQQKIAIKSGKVLLDCIIQNFSRAILFSETCETEVALHKKFGINKRQKKDFIALDPP